MKFTKMHGAGNDYIYVDCFSQPVPDQLERLARQISHRRYGIGGDGLILIQPSETADARMQMLNADGSEGEMCGNGIRCVAKYVYDHGIARQRELKIETGAGILELQLQVDDQDRVRDVTVDMGAPQLDPPRIPTTLSPNRDGAVVGQAFQVGPREFAVTCVSMGNPHCILFVESADDELVHSVGPEIEQDARFPNRVNVEFVEVISPGEVRQRTWERGSGETWACGTGASAVCVAGVLMGLTNREIVNHLLGGDLLLRWDQDSNHVLMTGGAVEVFSGQWPLGK